MCVCACVCFVWGFGWSSPPKKAVALKQYVRTAHTAPRIAPPAPCVFSICDIIGMSGWFLCV